MNIVSGGDANPILRKLQSVFSVSDEEKAAILALPMQIRYLKADQDIVRQGDHPSQCFAILDGFAFTFKDTSTGSRQIVAFHLPGDIPDLLSLHLNVLDVSISTLTPSTIGFLRHEAARDLCERNPRIAAAFWRDTLIDAAGFREWVTNIGQRCGPSRIAHLLCEFLVRMRAVGLADGHTCPMPMTQGQLAEATGLSAVHVNRSIQQLRSSRLISLSEQTLKVLDWPGLKKTADFDPLYLHLKEASSAVN